LAIKIQHGKNSPGLEEVKVDIPNLQHKGKGKIVPVF
jgi:hypothetical protein